MIKWIIKNATYILLAMLVAGTAIVTWRMEHASNALKEAAKENRRLAEQVDAARKAVVAVMAESQAERSRVIRVEREIRYVETMPQTATCGDSVHAAVDIMRDRKN